MAWLQNKYLKLGLAIFLSLALFFILFPISQTSVRTIFQARDLARAERVYAGEWIPYGPELSGGGHSPGPFYYYLIGWTRALGGTWQHVEVLKFALTAAGLAGIWWLLSIEWGLLCGLIFISLCLSSRNLHAFLNWDWNGSYHIVFIALALILLIKRHWLAFCAVMALAVQVHMSLVQIFLVAAFIKHKGLRRSSYLAGLSLFAVLCAPYLYWSMQSHPGEWVDAFTALREGWNLLLGGETSWVVPRQGLLGSYSFYGEELLTLALLMALLTYRGLRDESHKLCARLLIFSAAAVFPFLFNVYSFQRYTLVFLILLFVQLSILLSQALKYSARKNIWYFAGALLCIHLLFPQSAIMPWLLGFGILASASLLLRGRVSQTIGISAALALLITAAQAQHWNFKLLYRDGVSQLAADDDHGQFLSTATIARVDQAIWQATGWDEETFRQRIFRINIHMENDLTAIYRDISRKGSLTQSHISGYFVILPTAAMGKAPVTNWSQWLLSQPLAEEILKGLRSQQITLGSAQQIDRVVLLPFFIAEGGSTPLAIHNLGYPYSDSPGDHELNQLELPADSAGVLPGRDGIWLYWNRCQHSGETNCRVGAHLKIKDQRIHFKLVGNLLARRAGFFPSEEWRDTNLNLICAKRSQSHTLAKRISGPVRSGARYLLAPLEFNFAHPCPATGLKAFEVTGVHDGQPLTLRATMAN